MMSLHHIVTVLTITLFVFKIYVPQIDTKHPRYNKLEVIYIALSNLSRFTGFFLYTIKYGEKVITKKKIEKFKNPYIRNATFGHVIISYY